MFRKTEFTKWPDLRGAGQAGEIDMKEEQLYGKGVSGMGGRVVAIQPFLDGIRRIESPRPQAMPLRSEYIFPDPYRITRIKNSEQYNSLKDQFIDGVLFRGEADKPGIYFFIDLVNDHAEYYYIGISGTRQNQNTALRERLRKHLLTFDYILYSLAFPSNRETYYKECLDCYAGGIYQNNAPTYKRQYAALKKRGITHIAWVSDTDVNYTVWDHVETYYISTYKPPANARKLHSRPSTEYAQYYQKCESFLSSLIDSHTHR